MYTHIKLSGSDFNKHVNCIKNNCNCKLSNQKVGYYNVKKFTIICTLLVRWSNSAKLDGPSNDLIKYTYQPTWILYMI